MTTLPPENSPTAGETHVHRHVAEGFGADAGRYDRARPSYPAELVDRIIAASPGCDVLDVGCGTGISSRLFQAAGCTVLGVDADRRMADQARSNGTAAEVAKFEDWEPAGRSFDIVIAAQAWHWVDPVAGAAKAASVLRAGGRLAVFWNAAQAPPEIGAAFAEVTGRVLPGWPGGSLWTRPILETYRSMGAKAADGIRQAGAFSEPEEWLSGWDLDYTREEWLDVVPTYGGMGQLPPETLRELLNGFGAVIDAAGGGFTMHYDTLAITAAHSGA